MSDAFYLVETAIDKKPLLLSPLFEKATGFPCTPRDEATARDLYENLIARLRKNNPPDGPKGLVCRLVKFSSREVVEEFVPGEMAVKE